MLGVEAALPTARLDVGAHLHKFAAGVAPELGSGGATVEADSGRGAFGGGSFHGWTAEPQWRPSVKYAPNSAHPPHTATAHHPPALLGGGGGGVWRVHFGAA